MTSFTIKNIPDSVHQKLKERAKQHKRSLNSEILAQLEAAVEGAPVDLQTVLHENRELRQRAGVTVSQKDLNASKGQGRA